MRFATVLVLFASLLGASGCAFTRQRLAGPVNVCGKRGVIFAVDGAGDFHASSEALADAVAAARLPLAVLPFEWSHGYGRFIADQVDHAHSVCEGRRLAGAILAWRQCYPHFELNIVSHSAGSAVTLAAAEALPPDSVDHILLLAPAVSCCHDLRPALRSARQGVDVFYSERDRVILGLGIALLGPADRQLGTCAAGRVGFDPIVESPADACLYAKLRQHPWSRSVLWSGNKGGHYGPYQPGYLRAYVLPALVETRNPTLLPVQ